MSYGQKTNDPKVKLEDLFFYFDSQEKDWLDQGRLGRKNGQVLALRQKLLSMPDTEFDMAITAIERIVEGRPQEIESPMKKRKSERKAAMELFERVQTGSSTAAAEAVAKV